MKGSTKFALTYNGQELDASILSAIKARTVEYSRDTHGFTYAYIKTLDPTFAGEIEDAINDFNLTQTDGKIRFHPFFNEDHVVLISDGGSHFICKAISDQEQKQSAGRESTYSIWRLEDQPAGKKRKVAGQNKYDGKSSEELKTLLCARDEWLTEKNSQINSLQESLMSKDKEIESLDMRLLSKEDTIKAKETTIKELTKSKTEVTALQNALIYSKNEVIRTKQEVITMLRERDTTSRCTCDDDDE